MNLALAGKNCPCKRTTVRDLCIVVSALLWLGAWQLQMVFAGWAGARGLSPLTANTVVPYVIIATAFLHILASVFYMSVRVITKVWGRAFVSLAVAALAACLVAANRPHGSQILESYCNGLAHELSAHTDLDKLQVTLAVPLHSHVDQWHPVAVPAELLNVFHGPQPTLLLLPANSDNPRSVEVLWRTLGGVFGLHYGWPPVGFGRPLDHERRVADSLWVIVRQE